MYEEQALFEFCEDALRILTGNVRDCSFSGPFLSFELGLESKEPHLLPHPQLIAGVRRLRWLINGSEWVLYENGVFLCRNSHENKFHSVAGGNVGSYIEQLLSVAILERDRVYPVTAWSDMLTRRGESVFTFVSKHENPD